MTSKQASLCSVHTCRSTDPTPVSLRVGSATTLTRRPAGQWLMLPSCSVLSLGWERLLLTTVFQWPRQTGLPPPELLPVST